MSLVTASNVKDVPTGKAKIVVLNQQGDTTFTYDPISPTETAQAREIFDRAMGGGGRIAFAVDAPPKAGGEVESRSISEFEPATSVVVSNALQGG